METGNGATVKPRLDEKRKSVGRMIAANLAHTADEVFDVFIRYHYPVKSRTYRLAICARIALRRLERGASMNEVERKLRRALGLRHRPPAQTSVRTVRSEDTGISQIL